MTSLQKVKSENLEKKCFIQKTIFYQFNFNYVAFQSSICDLNGIFYNIYDSMRVSRHA